MGSMGPLTASTLPCLYVVWTGSFFGKLTFGLCSGNVKNVRAIRRFLLIRIYDLGIGVLLGFLITQA